jgi:hypothetical protein
MITVRRCCYVLPLVPAMALACIWYGQPAVRPAPAFSTIESEGPRHAVPAIGAELDESSLVSPLECRWIVAGDKSSKAVALCQFTVPQSRVLNGVDGQSWQAPCREPNWASARPILWEEYGQGEYLGPARAPHVPEYRLRVDDQLEFVYRFTHEEIRDAYRLLVGDEIIIESFPLDDPNAIRRGDINQGRGLVVQPDGTIVLPLLGRVSVVGRTIEEVKRALPLRR